MECDKPAASLKHCEGADQETQIMAQAVATIVTLKGGLVNSDFKLLNQVLWLHRPNPGRNSTLLHLAALLSEEGEEEAIDVVRLLLASGAKAARPDALGETPLMS
eukprot:s546_g4.t1